MNRLVACGLFTLLTSSSVALAQYGSSGPGAFAIERWEEDYSHLKDNPDRNWYESIKYIPLNDAGDWYVSFGGQARYRYDYFNNRGFGPGANDENGFHLQRYLVHADVHFGEHVRTFVELGASFNDGRVGGSRYGDEQRFDLQHAFVDIRSSEDENPYAYVRVGRQELIYGAERLISPDDWRNVRRSFDGVKLAVSIPNDTFEIFVTRPTLIEQYQWDNPEPETLFAGIYNVTALPSVINAEANSKLDTYFFSLNQGDESTAGVDQNVYTVGVRFHTKPAPMDYDIEAAYQFGDVDDDSLSAWMIAGESGYRFDDVALSPRISAGFDIASGSPDPDGRFNQLFPPTYTHLGHLYLFGRPNIVNVHAGVDLHLSKQYTLTLDHHVFWRQNDDDALYDLSNNVVRADNGSDANYIGNEFNIALYWQYNKHLSAYIGYAHFFTGDFISETGASKDVDFLYAAVQWTF